MDHATEESRTLFGRKLGECSTENEFGYHQFVARVDFAGDASLQLDNTVRIAVAKSTEYSLPPPHLNTKVGVNKGNDNTDVAHQTQKHASCTQSIDVLVGRSAT